MDSLSTSEAMKAAVKKALISSTTVRLQRMSEGAVLLIKAQLKQEAAEERSRQFREIARINLEVYKIFRAPVQTKKKSKKARKDTRGLKQHSTLTEEIHSSTEAGVSPKPEVVEEKPPPNVISSVIQLPKHPRRSPKKTMSRTTKEVKEEAISSTVREIRTKSEVLGKRSSTEVTTVYERPNISRGRSNKTARIKIEETPHLRRSRRLKTRWGKFFDIESEKRLVVMCRRLDDLDHGSHGYFRKKVEEIHKTDKIDASKNGERLKLLVVSLPKLSLQTMLKWSREVRSKNATRIVSDELEVVVPSDEVAEPAHFADNDQGYVTGESATYGTFDGALTPNLNPPTSSCIKALEMSLTGVDKTETGSTVDSQTPIPGIEQVTKAVQQIELNPVEDMEDRDELIGDWPEWKNVGLEEHIPLDDFGLNMYQYMEIFNEPWDAFMEVDKEPDLLDSGIQSLLSEADRIEPVENPVELVEVKDEKLEPRRSNRERKPVRLFACEDFLDYETETRLLKAFCSKIKLEEEDGMLNTVKDWEFSDTMSFKNKNFEAINCPQRFEVMMDEEDVELKTDPAGVTFKLEVELNHMVIDI